MKKTILLLMSALAIIACGGGSDAGGGSATGGNEYLNVQNVDIPGGNTTATLQISASQNCDWTITWSESWIRSIMPSKGRGTQNATITVTANPSSTESRTTIIKVSNASGTIVRDVTITQSPNETLTDFRLSTTELSANAPAGTVQFNIVGDAQWTIASNKNWATPNTMSGAGNASISVALADNTSEEAREATITVSSNSKSETVTIRQGTATKPTVSALNANYDGKTSAVVNFSYNSMFPVTEYGVCYNTTGQPTVSDAHQSETGNATQGTTTVSLTGLSYSTTYYVRAYARSAVGITYSESTSFTTANNWPGGDDNTPPDV
jgi:hypothetical protein